MNVVVLYGTLSSDPVMRSLASGSLLCSLEVTTTVSDGPAASVPVAWFDPPSEVTWSAGDAVVVSGVVRRRFFRSGSVTQSRTEVVADRVTRARSARDVGRVADKAIGRAVAALGVPGASARAGVGRVQS